MGNLQRSRLARPHTKIGRRALLALIFPALLLGLSPAAFAQLAATVSATGQYQYNSNVFDLQRGFYPGEATQAASYYEYGAALNLNDQISQQNIYLRGDDNQFVYDRFGLTHNEYAVDGGWLFKFADELSGSIDVSRSRVMVPFTSLVTFTTQALQLYTATDQRETATADYQFIPDWTLNVHGYTDRDTEPLVGEPDLLLSDSGAGTALRFGGNGEFKGAVVADYQHGDYAHATLYLSPSYNQWSGGIDASYQPVAQGSPTVVDFGFGRTSRVSPNGVDDVSGWTGHLNVSRELTGKTTLHLILQRNVNSFLTNAGAEIDSSAAVSAVWQATFKTGFTLGYTLDYTVYPDFGVVPGEPPINRGDHLQYTTFTINYLATRWLTIMPYFYFQTRASNLDGANFNATQYGVSFTIAWQNALAAGAGGR